ncbi:MAG: hypothetical protein OMM_02144 [Candidatus Magnetoglobus multicellularis str. Araruama]|uniref:IgGFc-binding protein N-terminal domain-containing protein n=1 Tax=Candidatus Magnetoglobus multicellularis str. Araruama TaxID=890399 RepID=A0A1V1PAN4_9BACT|nr:MAG: hypothetical protein OMM_02144 [Candidatus Magnetoglobus multicellularis str. Araruama]
MKYCKHLIILTMCIFTWIQSNADATTTDMIARHYTDTPIYANKTRISLSTVIEYNYTDIASLGLEISIPDTWKFISFSDPSLPLENSNGLISTYWVNIPEKINIQYDVDIPENETTVQSIAALVKYRRHGIDDPLYAEVLPNPLQLASSGYYITATAGTGGQIIPSGMILVAANQSQVFSIQPSLGYTISELLVDNQSVPQKNSYIFSNVDDNHLIDVSFKKHKLTPTHFSDYATYEPGVPLVIHSRIDNPYDIMVSSLRMRISIPYQWSFVSTHGDNPPAIEELTDNIINFEWVAGLTDDIAFSYTLQPYAMAYGQKQISAELIYRDFDDTEITTPISPDIYLNRKIDPDNQIIQGIIYLDQSPAPDTVQIDVSLMYLNDNEELEMIENKSDGPNYMLSFIDPKAKTYTLLASYEGYTDTSYIFSQLPDIQDIFLTKITHQNITVTDIDEFDSSATTVYEKQLPSIQVGNEIFLSGQKLEAQGKNQHVGATIDIVTGSLKQVSSSPAVISYTLREGIISTSPYVSKSNGSLLEINIANADIDQQKGIRVCIPLQSNISISDFRGDKPPLAVFHAPDKTALFDGTNIMSVAPEDLLEIKDQCISFITRSLSIFSVGEKTYYQGVDPTPVSSDESNGGCFIESCMKN